MKYKHILIVTYGRTGSTLLQGVLNSINGCVVRGENYNFCYGLFKSYKSLIEIQEKQGGAGQDVTKPFFGSHLVNQDMFFSNAYTLLKNQLGVDQADCWGFKEIRYTPGALQGKIQYELKEYLGFLNKLMPECAFVFLGRSIEDVLNSAFWKDKNKDRAVDDILKFELNAKEWMGENLNSFWIDYSDLVNISGNLKDFYKFIGVPFNNDDYKKILGVEHSYAGKSENLNKTKYTDLVENVLLKRVQSSKVQSVKLSFLDSGDYLKCEGTVCNLTGVVLLEEGLSQCDYLLKARVCGEEYPIEWFIPSPLINEKYNNNHNSKVARFKGVIPIKSHRNEVEVFLVSRNQVELIFTIK